MKKLVLLPLLIFVNLYIVACSDDGSIIGPYTTPANNPSPKPKAIVDTLFAQKDVTLKRIYYNYSPHQSGVIYENYQDKNRVGTHIYVFANIAYTSRYSMLIYFGDIKQTIQARQRSVKRAYIIFDLVRTPVEESRIQKIELSSSYWSEQNADLRNMPNSYNDSKFYTEPKIENGKCTVWMTKSVQLIAATNRPHGGFLFYSDAREKESDYYSFSTRESSNRNDRPRLIIEYEN